MSKKRKSQSDYAGRGYFVGFLANAIGGGLATVFGLSGSLFYMRKMDAIDLGAVVLGLALMACAAYFAVKMTRTIKV